MTATMLRGAVAAEWTKLRSVRSTYWLLCAGAATTIGLAGLITFGLGSDNVTVEGEFDPVGISLLGVWFGHIGFAVAGVLVMTSEYTTGTIRSSMAAVPRRGVVLLAKLLLVGGVALLVGVVVSLAAFLLGQLVLGGLDDHRSAGLSDPNAVPAVLGAAGFLAVMAMLGAAVGALLRHTTAAVLATLAAGLAPVLFSGMFPGWLRERALPTT